MSSTHLFILTKRLRLTIANTSLTINILIPVYLHKNVTHNFVKIGDGFHTAILQLIAWVTDFSISLYS